MNMNMNQILKQAQELQKQLKNQQDELSKKEYEASAGGGMVNIKANGRGEITSMAIDPEVVNPDDIEMLQDLCVAAVNEVLKRVQEEQQDQMASAMGNLGLKIPGIA